MKILNPDVDFTPRVLPEPETTVTLWVYVWRFAGGRLWHPVMGLVEAEVQASHKVGREAGDMCSDIRKIMLKVPSANMYGVQG